MNSPSILSNLPGEWTGENHLWLSPEEPARISECSASVSKTSRNQALCIQYAWYAHSGLQEGLLLLGFGGPVHENGLTLGIEAVWIDSFHTNSRFMICKGSLQQDGAVSIQGSYAAPPGPDWGWRIFVDPGSAGVFRVAMYNISPEGKEDLAVKMELSRTLVSSETMV